MSTHGEDPAVRLDTRASVSSRELRVNPGAVWHLLRDEKDLVVTSKGKPIGVLTVADEDSLEKFLEVAVSAGSSALVTGNLRHYPAERRLGTVALTPREFLGVWTHGGDGS